MVTIDAARYCGFRSPRGLLSAFRRDRVVLFAIELKTRRIHIAGITSRADGEWMAQIARNLIESITGPLNGVVYLIVDRARCTPSISRLFCPRRA